MRRRSSSVWTKSAPYPLFNLAQGVDEDSPAPFQFLLRAFYGQRARVSRADSRIVESVLRGVQ